MKHLHNTSAVHFGLIFLGQNGVTAIFVIAIYTKWVCVGYYVWTTWSIIKSYKHTEPFYVHLRRIKAKALSFRNSTAHKTWPLLFAVIKWYDFTGLSLLNFNKPILVFSISLSVSKTFFVLTIKILVQISRIK